MHTLTSPAPFETIESRSSATVTVPVTGAVGVHPTSRHSTFSGGAGAVSWHAGHHIGEPSGVHPLLVWVVVMRQRSSRRSLALDPSLCAPRQASAAPATGHGGRPKPQQLEMIWASSAFWVLHPPPLPTVSATRHLRAACLHRRRGLRSQAIVRHWRGR